ncbi:hypothetical protein TM1040_0818 [Ruegeria sp. TM1040]|nr:hypothetical protein TM1040_0818 [Ruegeria sp. TM1040]
MTLVADAARAGDYWMRKILIAVATVGAIGFAPSNALGAPKLDELGSDVSLCWNDEALSDDAARATTTVEFHVGQDGLVDLNTIKIVSSTAITQTASKQAFEAARRAIIRCLMSDPVDLSFWDTTLEAVFSVATGVKVRYQPNTTVDT